MENKPLILVVEDEKPIRNFICVTLVSRGFRTLEATTGFNALSLSMSHKPDIIILDLGLPDIDGLEIIKKVREWSKMPIVVVSARGQEKDKVTALDLGADDYLTKPFGVEELIARVRVALRHSLILHAAKSDNNYQFVAGELQIDFEKRKVMLIGKEIHLTPTEYKLIALLAGHAGKVLTHNFILKEIWGHIQGDEIQALRVNMANLRRKIENDPARPRYIKTEVGVGYRLVEE